MSMYIYLHVYKQVKIGFIIEANIISCGQATFSIMDSGDKITLFWSLII